MIAQEKTHKPRHINTPGFLERVISNMPYAFRLRNYEKEKQELFYEMHRLSSVEIQARHRALAEKWQV